MIEGVSLADPHTVPTRYWHPLDDGRIQCDLCPRACRLHEGQRGLCFVRGARRTTRWCSPPTAARAGSASTRSRRSRSTTSCPARRCSRSAPPAATSACKFCQNWDISQVAARSTRLADAGVARGDRRARPSGSAAASVAFTYNDPVIFAEYAIDVADACHARGHQDASPSPPATSAPSRAREFYAHMDAANVDLKAFTEDFYQHVCGGAPRSRCSTRCEYLRARDRRLVRDHDAAHPRPERLRRRARRDDRAGSPSTSAPTCRCTSPRSTPTSRCATSRRRRRRR